MSQHLDLLRYLRLSGADPAVIALNDPEFTDPPDDNDDPDDGDFFEEDNDE